MNIKQYCAGSLNVEDVFRTIHYRAMFEKNNPDYFHPDGIWVFCGPQGSGKTLSAVQVLQKICKEYPKAKVCTNLEVKGIENEIIEFTNYTQIETLTNGIYGIIFFLDEIQTLWNSLESKDIPISQIACFCQMRKDRRLIIGTSQKQSRIAKPIREQFKYLIDCHNFFGILQCNTIIDPQEGEEKNGVLCAKIIGRKFWFHRPELYDSYDTLKKIKKPKSKGGTPNGRVSSPMLQGNRIVSGTGSNSIRAG